MTRRRSVGQKQLQRQAVKLKAFEAFARGFMAKRDEATPVRSRWSGRAGVLYASDPHVWIEGPGVAGWYRLSDVHRDFLPLD